MNITLKDSIILGIGISLGGAVVSILLPAIINMLYAILGK